MWSQKIGKDKKKYFYDSFADCFDSEMNRYDLNKRLSIVFDRLIQQGELKGKNFLDVGCGTGWFSRRAVEMRADVVSVDLGYNLLKKVSQKCSSKKTVSDTLSIGIKDKIFDYVLATEVIEHTPDPKMALSEMHRVLKMDGILIITVPNRIWHFTLNVARIFNARRYDGYENWVGYYQLKDWLKELGFEVEKMFGFHLFPFVLPFLNPLISFLDRFYYLYSPAMLNIAVRCRKMK